MMKQGKIVRVLSSVSGKEAPNVSVDASDNSTSSNCTTEATSTTVSSTPIAVPATSKHQDTSSLADEVETLAMGMKHSKSDYCGLGGRKDKHKDSKSSLGKKYISKSQDNLSDHKKSKPLATVVEAPKPRENAASLARAEAARSEKIKENSTVKEKHSNFAKPKPVKPNSLPANIRKTSSTLSIDKTNQSSSSVKSSASKSSNNLAIKRAQSTQNVSKVTFMKKRTSAPADVMAYNAELLANFEKEKKILEGRISELVKVAEGRKGEIEKYKYEIRRLKERLSLAVDKEEIELLRNQNKQLQDRLQELGFPAEQITDSEKLMLKLCNASTARSHDSSSDICLQASISCDSLSTDGSGAKGGARPLSMSSVGGGGLKTLVIGAGGSDLRRSTSLSASEPGMSLPDLCGTPDHPSILSLDTVNWDKHSNKSANSDGALSEASVACLTERILQMEETNYSTTEELQATLQELSDLQDAVNELTEENTKLTDEKAVLLQSLCTQTEKLENTRIQLEQLKCLLISGELPDKSDRDSHLLSLLKSAQEEREELMRKQFEWSNALQSLENECKEAHEAEEFLRDKYSVLEEANTSLKSERDGQGKQLWEMRESQAAEQAEVSRLKTLLESERNKVIELEVARCAQDKTDIEALLDIARQDKDRTEQKVADLVESLSLSQCEVTRLKDCLVVKEQEVLAARNNAKTQVTDLHFRIDVTEKEKQEAKRELDTLKEHVEQLEAVCDSHLEDKKNLTAKLQELQTELRNTKQQRQIIESELQEISSKHDVESEEWKQFQRDLQLAVVIANNFSQETQEKMEKLTLENAQLLEQVSTMKIEFEKLQQENKVMKQTAEEFSPRKHSILTNAELKGKVFTTMDRELAALREGRPHMDHRSQSISVKSLIRSIEEQVKSGCSSIQSSHSESRRSSSSSDISLRDIGTLASPLATPDNPLSPTKEFSLRTSGLKSMSVERSPQSRNFSGTAVVGGGTPSPDAAGKGVLGSRVDGCESGSGKGVPQISSILKDRNTPRRSSAISELETPKKETLGRDPLSSLAKLMKGSKRNALLKWCQLKTIPYSNVDITNFSSSWNDGLGFCALLHSYVPEKIPYSELTTEDKRKNLTIAFNAGESIGIKATLNINDMVSMERPDWQAVMNYVTSIYRHFEVDRP